MQHFLLSKIYSKTETYQLTAFEMKSDKQIAPLYLSYYFQF